MKRAARDVRKGDRFALELEDDFEAVTRVEFIALSVSTVTPLHDPDSPVTRIWADTGRIAHGPGPGNEKIPLDLPTNVQVEIVE